MMTVTTDQQQQQQQQFHERITLDPFNKSPYLKGVKSTIETKTIIPHNVNASSEQSKSNMTLLPTPQNALLISILDELQLDSFTISTSDSSDSSISLPRAVDVEIDTTNNSNVWSSSPLTFPVGTAIQYTEMSSAASVNYGSGGVNHESGDFEKTLLRVLSKDGLLCNNVPLDEKLQTIYPTSIKNSSSLGNKNSKSTSSSIHSTNTNTNTIMISNDAYTLCHIESLYRMIIASSPCRDQVGVFSKFDFHTMNDGHVFQKASWMSVKRIMKDKHHAIEIDWGLRYQKRIMRLLPLEMQKQKQKQTNQVSLSDILLQTNNNNNNAVSDLLQSCPLSTSSAIIVSRQHGHDNQTYDLKSKDMDMRTNIVSLDDSMSNFGTIGTQRSVKRPSGVAHFGAFHSKYYFDCDKVCQTNYDTTTTLLSAAEGIDVSILEYYPNVVKPVFHTFKAYLMSHEANQNGEFSWINQTLIVKHVSTYIYIYIYIHIDTIGIFLTLYV
jgi:hypothetical protein